MAENIRMDSHKLIYHPDVVARWMKGEPLLHKEAPNITNKTKSLGIDAAMSANGVLLTPEVSRTA